MDELRIVLRLAKDDVRTLFALRTRLVELVNYYRNLIASVPSDLPGAPFNVSLTRRHDWVDSHLLNPIDQILEALKEENRPMLSTWPEFIPTGRMPDFDVLENELKELQNLGRYIWINTRIRRKHNVSPGWEIKFEIVRSVAEIFGEVIPNLKPSRGTYDRSTGRYTGSFPEAIVFVFREITGIENERLDRQIADYIQSLKEV